MAGPAEAPGPTAHSSAVSSFVSIALDVKKTAVATVPRLREAVGYEEVDQSAARVRFEVHEPRPFLSSPPTRGWFLSLYLISQSLRSATFYKTHGRPELKQNFLRMQKHSGNMTIGKGYLSLSTHHKETIQRNSTFTFRIDTVENGFSKA